MIKIHLKNQEIIEVDCKLNDVVDMLEEMSKMKESRINIMAICNKYIIDLDNINYIEGVN